MHVDLRNWSPVVSRYAQPPANGCQAFSLKKMYSHQRNFGKGDVPFMILHPRRGSREFLAQWILGLLVVAFGFTTSLQARPLQDPQISELQQARDAEQKRIKIIREAARASICVFPATGGGGGSGVVITPDGYALTNYHVVKPCGSYMHCSMPDGKLYDAVLVGMDPTGDVAMIKLLGREDFPVANLGDSDTVRVGDECFAVGNPFLLATDFQPSISWGIVSGTHRYQYPAGTLLEYADCIQTDAAINPGNSGGPLFNDRGELVGINGRGSFEKRGRVNVGVGYAISINQIKLFMDHLASGRIVDHATLGATVSSSARGRVVVDNILQSSDAFRRGLRYDDEIIAFGGRSIETVNEFKNVLGVFPKDWRVPLEFRRDGKTYSVSVRLAGVHSSQQLAEMVQGQAKKKPPIPGVPRPDPDKPIPHKPNPKSKSKIKIPDHAQELIVDRRGFANYYFNQLRRDDIWSRFQIQNKSIEAAKKWQITGQLGDGTPVTIVLSQQGSGMKWGDQTAVLDSQADLGQQLNPTGSGGLLPALHLWHRLVTGGPESYGDVFYLGRLPASDSQRLAHVLNATYDVMETKFFFDPQNAELIALEMWSDPDKDPCEIHFEDYAIINETYFPRMISVHFADNFQWSITVDNVTISND